MNWYKMATETRKINEDWNVISIGPNSFQLLYKEYPIQDYALTERGGIKELKTYGFNFVTKVPKGTKLPLIIQMYSAGVDLGNQLV
jgi:hypothetical protein